MSKIALTPNASGTGTFTLAAPNSNTSRTITLPDEAGEVLVNGTNQNVGIGTSSPDAKLKVTATGANLLVGYSGTQNYFDASENIFRNFSGSERMRIDSSGNVGVTGGAKVHFGSTTDSSSHYIKYNSGANGLEMHSYGSTIFTNYTGTERMRIDSSGNLLVGQSSSTAPASANVIGAAISPLGYISTNRTSVSAEFGTQGDGDIVVFRESGSAVGSIGTASADMYLGTDNTGFRFVNGDSSIRPFDPSTGSTRDNAIDLGSTAARFDDIYATNGTIQTSDRNEKQDIEVLSDAETRVAVACKGLLRKFRWQDAVAEKGDDARIHFGIIAQDLQDAFAAEGLDAGRYAMFISSTWWETQTEVPAVEAVDAVYEDVVIPAVLDEEGNELEAERTEQQLVTEAVEAKDAYTRTDTYETQAEAPEGATERTRLGVRYPELLAFIIGAM